MKKGNYIISVLAIVVGAVFLAAGRALGGSSLDGYTSANTWPNILSAILIALGILLAVVNTVSKNIPESKIDYKSPDFHRLLLFILLVLIYAALFYLLGCLIASAVFIPVFLAFFGERSWKLIVIYDGAFLILLYVLFEQVLKSPLSRPIFL